MTCKCSCNRAKAISVDPGKTARETLRTRCAAAGSRKISAPSAYHERVELVPPLYPPHRGSGGSYGVPQPPPPLGAPEALHMDRLQTLPGTACGGTFSLFIGVGAGSPTDV